MKKAEKDGKKDRIFKKPEKNGYDKRRKEKEKYMKKVEEERRC